MLMTAERSVLIVVDMHDLQAFLRNTEILMRAAARLDVPVVITEQYPKGLGPTLPRIAGLAPADAVVEKITFSAAGSDAFTGRLAALGRDEPVICGIEAHVCVLQTALDLHRRGACTRLVGDATTARQPASAGAARDRASRHGVEVVTTEMVVFEWLRRAGTPVFREVSALIR